MNKKTYLIAAAALIIVVLGILRFAATVNDHAVSVDLSEYWPNELGQMFMVGFYGTQAPPEILNLITEGKVGGVILLKYNLVSAEQIKNLINSLQAVAPAGKPLLIAIDQEGGIVSRLPEFLADATAQTDITDASAAYAVGLRRGRELASLGFNVVFSPVLDKIDAPESFLYERVFRGSVDFIAELGGAMIKGYRDAGIIACAKHFPGFADAAIDAHAALPSISIAENFDNYAAQFKTVLRDVSPLMLMSTHLIIKDLSSWPASLSPEIINNILREKWKYDGVVITDDMEMGALVKNYSLEKAAVAAVAAGNDLLLYVSTIDKYHAAHEAILYAGLNGDLSVDRLREAIGRVLKLKANLPPD